MSVKNIGKFIAKCRKEKNLTQVQLAEKLSISSKTVSKWETGISTPDIFLLETLSEILGVTPSEILKGEKISSKVEKEVFDNAYDSTKYYLDINNKKQKKKIIKIVLVMLLFFLFILGIILLKNNYNNCFIYSFTNKDDNYIIEGIMVDTTEKDMIVINSLIPKDESETKYYEYEYSLNVGEKQIYKNGNVLAFEKSKNMKLKPIKEMFEKIKIYVSEDDAYDEKLEKNFVEKQLTISIKYVDKNYEIQTIDIPLEKQLIFSNNKILYNNGEEF